MKNIALLLVTSVFLLFACGDPSVSIEETRYEPKIVVEAFVYPGEPVEKIWLMRNFELNTQVDSNSIYLKPDVNQVRAYINNVPLQFNSETSEYYLNDFQVDYGHTYRLVVDAVIDGIPLHTEIQTTTPNEGFDLLTNDLGNLIYRRNEVLIDFHPSPGTGFYIFSIRAEEASYENFIFNNPFFPNLDSTEIGDRFNNFKFQYNLLLNVSGTATDTISYEVLGLDTWFYGKYKVIVYAGDTNMKDFTLTANQVQTFDGNFKEPKFYFEGNGIGVFGSAIRDTLSFTLLRNN